MPMSIRWPTRAVRFAAKSAPPAAGRKRRVSRDGRTEGTGHGAAHRLSMPDQAMLLGGELASCATNVKEVVARDGGRSACMHSYGQIQQFKW